MEGRLLVQDRYMFMNYLILFYKFYNDRKELMFLIFTSRHIQGGNFVYGDNAYVGLALPGDVGSWQRQSKVFMLMKFSFYYIPILVASLN